MKLLFTSRINLLVAVTLLSSAAFAQEQPAETPPVEQQPQPVPPSTEAPPVEQHPESAPPVEPTPAVVAPAPEQPAPHYQLPNTPGFVQLSHDQQELVVELNPHVYGNRARTHKMRVMVEADPISQGRLVLSYQIRVHDWITLIVPVAAEYFKANMLYEIRVYSQPNLVQEGELWGVSSGFGARFRVSEWFLKSHIFVEPMVLIGYFQQESSVSNRFASAVRFIPSVAVGWERVFDVGLVASAKVGVEMPFDYYIANGGQQFTIPPRFGVSPQFGLGYAW